MASHLRLVMFIWATVFNLYIVAETVVSARQDFSLSMHELLNHSGLQLIPRQSRAANCGGSQITCGSFCVTAATECCLLAGACPNNGKCNDDGTCSQSFDNPTGTSGNGGSNGCPSGQTPCAQKCMPTGATCCTQQAQAGYCQSGFKCAIGVARRCYPNDAVDCENGTYCPAGQTCNGGNLVANGCLRPGMSTTTAGAASPTPTATSSTPPSSTSMIASGGGPSPSGSTSPPAGGQANTLNCMSGLLGLGHIVAPGAILAWLLC